MQDLVFVLLTVGFFALATLYIRGCAALAGDRPERISGHAGAGGAETDRPPRGERGEQVAP